MSIGKYLLTFTVTKHLLQVTNNHCDTTSQKTSFSAALMYEPQISQLKNH